MSDHYEEEANRLIHEGADRFWDDINHGDFQLFFPLSMEEAQMLARCAYTRGFGDGIKNSQKKLVESLRRKRKESIQ